MKEEFIAYLWKFCLLKHELLHTTDGDPVTVINPGLMNRHAGPDFTAAKIRIGHTLWAGNIEIHVHASDWYRHGHDQDKSYDNIVLHIVYEADKTVYNTLGVCLPTMEIKHCFSPSLLKNYMQLKTSGTWIACQHSIRHTDPLIIQHMLGRLVTDRLVSKAEEAARYLEYFGRNWEHTLYFLLARNFGYKVNTVPMGLLAQKTPLSLLNKAKHALHVVEALLFGQAGMLSHPGQDAYQEGLFREYAFQKRKHGLEPVNPVLWKFARMRPAGFPTLRIAQFARFIFQTDHAFGQLISSYDIDHIITCLDVTASSYWDTHYTFGIPASNKKKRLGNDTKYNIIINTLSPLMYLYGRETCRQTAIDFAMHILQAIPPENNHIMRKWQHIGIAPEHAGDSQALIELKKRYCTPKKCLDCHIGYQMMHAPSD